MKKNYIEVAEIVYSGTVLTRSYKPITLRDLANALEVSVNFILYENNTGNYIRNIEVLLNNKPESFIISIEKLIRFCISEFSDTDIENR